jgi:hypothetical protein
MRSLSAQITVSRTPEFFYGVTNKDVAILKTT